jgi:hypothetical protein
MKKYENPEINISKFSCERIAALDSAVVQSELGKYVKTGIEVKATTYQSIFKTEE